MKMGPQIRVTCRASLIGASVIAHTPELAQKILKDEVCNALGITVMPQNQIVTTQLGLVKMLKDMCDISLLEAKRKVEMYIKDNPTWMHTEYISS